ncbi:6251_t:CDS:2 [Ambispora leptoticha]|uniref:6251_t:CDS:1 n=1 Tax=Ambispora leptoticha TaxID=144679 RepID=A0A9N9A4I5_9GLOM|nr:6251_t:CDS:2 [Ambispora leptoticha]
MNQRHVVSSHEVAVSGNNLTPNLPNISLSQNNSDISIFHSSNVIEEKPALTLAEVIRKLNTEKLIEFLRGEEDLQFNDAHFEILYKREIASHDFLKMDKQDFRNCGLEVGPVIRLVNFAKKVKEKKLRAFSSYHSLREVLLKYSLDSDGIESISLFTLPTYEIQDNDKYFVHCMAEILFRLRDYGSLLVDSLESMWNEYVVTLLHSALHIVRDNMQKQFSMRP